jgi:hypothetical protein
MSRGMSKPKGGNDKYLEISLEAKIHFLYRSTETKYYPKTRIIRLYVNVI